MKRTLRIILIFIIAIILFNIGNKVEAANAEFEAKVKK